MSTRPITSAEPDSAATGRLSVLKVPDAPKTLVELAARIGANSELVEAARQVAKRKDNVLGLLLRELTREEIAVMEDRGCRASDWNLVQVAQDFDSFRVRRTHFKGACVVGRFGGEIEVSPGLSLPTGIYDCTLVACQIGNDCLLENVRFAANLIIEREAVLFDVGSITCTGSSSFGCGQLLPLAGETGGREVPMWAEGTVDTLAMATRQRGDATGQAALRDAVAKYTAAVKSPVAWVRRKARVLHSNRVRDAYIGMGAVVDNALDLSNSTVLSSVDEPTEVTGGAAVTDSILQWGVKITGNAIIRRSAMLEHSAADEHAAVESSVIGPNTTISKGEVTATLLGPFVGFHHQSLLIAAYWPEGKGNIAYGAMVGSNHTGRAPDQEIWPGEGAFFGLGCAIRFPTDFSEAPYMVIGMAVSTLPQRVRFPFSLITVPAETIDEAAKVPRAYNELIPAWGLYSNAYGLVRSELKFRQRDHSRRHDIDYKVLRPHIMRLVQDAYDRLTAVKTIKTAYLDTDIEGIGKNFLREATRLKAIQYYGQALTRYALRLLLNEREGNLQIPGSAEIAHELADRFLPKSDFDVRMRRLVEIERDNAKLVQQSKHQDDERGARVIPGYADAHTSAEKDRFVESAWDRVKRTEERVAAVGVRI
ncbi:MAG: DUF4954 family protein [Planctomycetes bacterium]|nr:DUF4954 family protein [Planctomycetota bacterium]